MEREFSVLHEEDWKCSERDRLLRAAVPLLSGAIGLLRTLRALENFGEWVK